MRNIGIEIFNVYFMFGEADLHPQYDTKKSTNFSSWFRISLYSSSKKHLENYE